MSTQPTAEQIKEDIITHIEAIIRVLQVYDILLAGNPAQTKQLVLRLARALYTDRLRKLVALLPADITEEVLAANAKISSVVTGFSEN